MTMPLVVSTLARTVGFTCTRDREIERFENELAEVCGHLHALHARMVAMVGDALEHEWWAQSGIRSPEHWLCWQTGLSPAHARQVTEAARRRGELPATMAAFDGDASSSIPMGTACRPGCAS